MPTLPAIASAKPERGMRRIASLASPSKHARVHGKVVSPAWRAPHLQRSVSDPGRLEELRRLAYVNAQTTGAPHVIGGSDYLHSRPYIMPRYLAHRRVQFTEDGEDDEDDDELVASSAAAASSPRRSSKAAGNQHTSASEGNRVTARHRNDMTAMIALLGIAPAAFGLTVLAPSSSRACTPRMLAREPLALSVDLPPRGKCNLKFKPLFEASEAVVVKYKLPFGLNVENQNGMPVCTKAGAGGEKEGDVLRYCTEWKIGLPGGEASPLATVASFSGAGLSYQLGLFDCVKAESWDDVVMALTSNTDSRTDQITMVFERPVQQGAI